MRLSFSVLAVSLISAGSLALAQAPEIISTSPVQNELHVSPSTDISVVFDSDMDPATINDSTFVVNSGFVGLHQGSIVYDSLTRTATFYPSDDFHVGDVVTAILTPGVQSSYGVPLESSWIWSFTVLTEDGSSLFVTDSVYPMGDYPYSIVTADLDADGDIDIAVSNYDIQHPYDPDSVWIFLNDGDAVFTFDSNYVVGICAASIFGADLDQDGDVDLASANQGSDDISVLLNNGDATFAPQSVYPVERSYCLTGADFDGDGDVDLAAGSIFDQQGWVAVLVNDGQAVFTPDSIYLNVGTTYSLVSADLDGDGDFDLASANVSPDVASVFLNNGDGTFTFHAEYAAGETPLAICGADLDGDGDIDLATANKYGDNLSVLMNSGDGTLLPRTDYDVVHDAPYDVYACDLDGDGDLDLTSATYGAYDQGGAAVLLNNGLGFFSLDSIYSAVNSFSLSAGDLDGDKDLDLVLVTHHPHEVRILLNRPETSISGVVFNDENEDGNQDPGEEGLPRWMVVLEPDSHAAITDSTGRYVFKHLDAGIFTVSEVVKTHWGQTHPDPPGTYVIPIDTGDVVTGYDFGNSILYDTLDAKFSFEFTRLRPGRRSYYTVQWENTGTVPWDSAWFEYVFPYELQPDTSNPKEWEECSHVWVDDGENWAFEYTVAHVGLGEEDGCRDPVLVPDTDTCGQVIIGLRRHFYVSSEGDFRMTEEPIVRSLVCSYDPNEKHVHPEDTIGVDTTLLYHIDFQNVGNDTAFDIMVMDTLRPNLDITTLQLGAHSHPYDFDIEGRTLIWTFNSILLPDSIVDEPRSHGFIEYTVKPLSTLSVGTTIENRAAIYFDFNPPVITNTVVNTIAALRVHEERPWLEPQGLTLSQNYPNPMERTTELSFTLATKAPVKLEVYNAMGQRVTTLVDAERGRGQHRMIWDGRTDDGVPVPTGLYFYRLSAGESTLTRKIIVLR